MSRTAIVLSGGGNRGALQVGALRALLEAGLEPELLVGTSIGAVNAAFLATNPSLDGVAQLADLYRQVHKEDVYPEASLEIMWALVQGRVSLYSNANWERFLQSYISAQHFAELALPAYLVAVDMTTNEPVIFGDHPDDKIIDGVMSSTALPPLHPPWQVGDRSFLDGGLIANLPVRAAIKRGATEIIALNLLGQRPPYQPPPNVGALSLLALDMLIARQVAADLKWLRIVDVPRRIFHLYPKQWLHPVDFSRSAELIERGYQLVKHSLDEVSLHHRPAS